MDKRPRESSTNGGFFSRSGPIFGGATKTTSSSRPSTSSSGARRTNNTSQSSTLTGPTLSPKASFTFLTKSPPPKPPSRARTAPVDAPFSSPNPASPEKRRPPQFLRTAADRKASNASSHSNIDTGERAHAAAPDRDWTSAAPYPTMLAYFPTGDIKARSASSAGIHHGFPSTGSLSNAPPSPSLETITYQHIQEMASKRISTLDYLRKAHEGRVYWFNTLLFNKPDLARLPYFDARRLGRRATNYLLLGVSLPTILDLNSSNAAEFLRSLNALLAEFEAYQQVHPPDGSAASLSRAARIPQLFKRAASSTGAKGRRASSAADIGLPMGSEADQKSMAGSMPAAAASFPTTDSDLLPGEEYSLLLTPSLPFDPDFYETFATLCDVLIDCYTKLLSLLASPKDCNTLIADMFSKADGRVRKIIVQGVVKEFEDSTRARVKSEVAGIGKIVLGGLM